MFSRGFYHAKVLLMVLTVGAAFGGCATVPIFREGRGHLPVIVAVDASADERAAGEELARVLGKMSGIHWPVQTENGRGQKGFHVGATKTARERGPALTVASDLLAPKKGEIGPDGFRIQSADGSVFIEGATPEATRYAVDWFLQKHAGVRWYVPGPTGEIIPRRTAWSLPKLDLVREPAYVSREFYPLGTPDEIVWGRRNGLRARLEFNHALAGVIPTKSLEAHPEWAPFLRGKRYQPLSPKDHNWQPNLALPEVAAHAARVAQDAFARDPGRASFSLGMNDTVRFDQGAETRGQVEPLRFFRGMPDYSPLVFTFMNRAAEAIAPTHPEKYLGCLAYFWAENTPPFRVHPQVLPYVTTDRSQFYDRAYREADLALMTRWGASGVRAYGLWEYGYGQSFLIPRVPHRALAEAVSEGWRRGARGYFADAGPHWGFDGFKLWLLAQLLWEPQRSYEELADDYFNGFYGPASRPMREFFERCEAQWMAQQGPPFWLKLYQQEDQALVFPPESCRELRVLLAQAVGKAAGDPVVTLRVERTSRAFAVTEAYAAFDATRRRLLADTADGAADFETRVGAWAEEIRRLLRERAQLEDVFSNAREGELPAMARTELSFFVRNDPVPRLLWLAGLRERGAPLRILKAAGPEAVDWEPWRALAAVIANGSATDERSLVVNGAFNETATTGQEPRFLFPHSGDLPSGWEITAVPTERGKVVLVDVSPKPPGRSVRIEGAWDTQVYQWLPAEPGRSYVAQAQLRGESRAGNDSALFMTFLSAEGGVVGTHRMQSLPKGPTIEWWTAVLADTAPADAVWVGVGVGTSRQTGGDWLEVGGIELRRAREEVAR